MTLAQPVPEASIRRWLDEVWPRARRVVVLDGGEDGPPPWERQVLASVEDPALVRRMRGWMTAGGFAGDTCRCTGDLTLALLDADQVVIGSATAHPDRLAWERSRFGNDLLSPRLGELRLLLARFGVDGASRSLLAPLIMTLELHEGEEPTAPRIPASPRPRPLDLVARADGDEALAVRRLLAWLGTATWPTEAISGDAELARRMLGELDPGSVARVLLELSEPADVMGAVVLAAFRDDDAAIMAAVAPAVARLLGPGDRTSREDDG